MELGGERSAHKPPVPGLVDIVSVSFGVGEREAVFVGVCREPF